MITLYIMKLFSCCKDKIKDNTVSVRIDCSCFTKPRIINIKADDEYIQEIIAQRIHDLMNEISNEVMQSQLKK